MADNKKDLNPFEMALKAYLDKRAKEDKLFAKSYAKEGKTIQKCAIFIFGEAEKKAFKSERYGKMAALPDEEVYGLAVHYYDEDDLEIDKMPKEKVDAIKEKIDKVSVATPVQFTSGVETSLF